MTNIRYFNQKGRQSWSDWLENLQADSTIPIPGHLLEGADYTRVAPGSTPAPAAPGSKFELASALADPIDKIEAAGLPIDCWPGLWDWLAAFYFNSLCPKKADNSRTVMALARYKLEQDFRRYYRHRICGPVSRVRNLGVHSKIMLHGLPSTLTDWEEQAAARYETGGNPGIAEALCMLYWDETTDRPKRGAAPNKKTPGTLRRFGDIMRQFALTYDLSAIGAEGLLGLLPGEFNKWKPNQP